MEQKIIFATGNQGKMREIRKILGDMGVEIQSMKEAGIELDIVEDGSTFEENAVIKAKAVAEHSDWKLIIWEENRASILPGIWERIPLTG